MSFARNKVTAILGSAVAIGGVSAGVAFGTGGGQASAPSGAPAAPPLTSATVDPEITSPEPGSAEPAGPDTDTVQEGDQTTPDGPNEKAESAEGPTEGAEADEADGGHEDPPGKEVDHQHEGAE